MEVADKLLRGADRLREDAYRLWQAAETVQGLAYALRRDAFWLRGLPSSYTDAVRSVADDLRDELQEEVLRLPFEERMALVLKLGERGLEIFCQASGLDRETAIRELQRQRQAGRTPSKCMSEIIG